jgi:hypothetical protein
MKRYHDSHLSPTDAHPAQSERLYVPAFEPTHRRSRSHEHIEVREAEPPRSYKLREAVPARLSDPGDGELAGATPHELARRPTSRSNRPRRPSIKVQIHQDTPPSPLPSKQTPSKSPGVSPRSPSAVPQLQFQYATLQDQLKEIGTTCMPYLNVEAAHPRDLTFTKIVERCQGFAFDLEVWGHVVNVRDMARIDTRKREIVEATSRTLDRMIEKVTALSRKCGELKPKDLKVDFPPEIENSESDEDENDDESDSVEWVPQRLVQAPTNERTLGSNSTWSKAQPS